MYVNVGTQLKALWIFFCLCFPDLVLELKNYDKVSRQDKGPYWCFMWSIEQLFMIIMPTIQIIMLSRPALFKVKDSVNNSNSSTIDINDQCIIQLFNETTHIQNQ